MNISTDFPGGNIDVISVENDVVCIKPQFRDTSCKWFYWAFKVSGAAGRTMTFDLSPLPFVGYHGPAVSHDLDNWSWAGGIDGYSRFSYTFKEDEDSVYFAHDMLYSIKRFDSFIKRTGLHTETLCVSEKGREVPVVRFGKGKDVILLTARHHCCESTGSYVLEGVLEELMRDPIQNYTVMAVPFVDIDGVAQGDQGKCRKPHDHNRDYTASPIYSCVRSIKALIADNPVRYAFDLHSPWHFSGRNDKLFFVRGREEDMDKYLLLGELFERESGGAAMKYSREDDIDPNKEWNTREDGPLMSFSGYCEGREGMELALSTETTYFGLHDDIVSQDKLVRSGWAFARALREYIKIKY
ncbi:MAG: M14-type cytosolic carboxypeptidase [Eubacteriales bacterium]